MKFLLLAIVSSALISIIMRLGTDKVKNNIGMLVVNYLVCIIISGLYAAENANVQPAPQEDEIILFLGDSITQGFFGQGTVTWANLFALGRKSGIVNLGVGGGKMPF